MLRQLRHDVWATETLIAFMRTQGEKSLELSAPGTYGTIRRTLEHIVAADERYLLRLGVPRPEPALSEEADVPLDEIARHLAFVKDAVEGIFAGKEFEPDRWVVDTRRPERELESWVMVTQMAHHGSDHRAHIGTILGAHGIEGPPLDVWAYGQAVGAIRERR
jgi:uncharacterized damage-inducible protein DinB